MKAKNPTIHRYLFTVTSFSKLLAMTLFITLPFIGFYLGMQYQQKLTISTPFVSKAQETAVATPTPILTPTPNQMCNIDSDCQNGAKCMEIGPLILNKPNHKVCISEGQMAPLSK